MEPVNAIILGSFAVAARVFEDRRGLPPSSSEVVATKAVRLLWLWGRYCCWAAIHTTVALL